MAKFTKFGKILYKIVGKEPNTSNFTSRLSLAKYWNPSWCKLRIMSSTSQKHRNFVSEPMGEKPVTELAGIGPVLGDRLKDKGYDKAYVVLGQFLLVKKDEEMFVDWIKGECGANKKQGSDCYNCLKEWCDAFL